MDGTLSAVLRGENPITPLVLNHEFAQSPRRIPNVNFVRVADLLRDLPAESFDYIVGTTILCQTRTTKISAPFTAC